MPPSCSKRLDGGFDERRLIEHDGARKRAGNIEQMLQLGANAVHNRNRVRVAALLQDRKIHRALPIHANRVVLQRVGILRLADIGEPHRRLPDDLDRRSIHGRQIDLVVGVDVVIAMPDLHVPAGQDDVRLIQRAHHIHQAQLVGFELVRDRRRTESGASGRQTVAERKRPERLPAGCGYCSARYLSEPSPSGPAPFNVTRQTGRLDASNFRHDGRKRAGRQIANIRHRKIRDRGSRGIRIASRLEVNLDDADAGQRPRFDMLDAARKREESLQVVGDVAFNLLRRPCRCRTSPRPRPECSWSGTCPPASGRRPTPPDDRNDQADNNDEVRGFDRKTRHSKTSASPA